MKIKNKRIIQVENWSEQETTASIDTVGLQQSTLKSRARESVNFYRLPIPKKFSKLLLPTPSKKFYFIAIRKYIIQFYAIYYYFHSLIASNKYRNMFIRLILLIFVTNCKNFQFFCLFFKFLYKKNDFLRSRVGNLNDFFTTSQLRAS